MVKGVATLVRWLMYSISNVYNYIQYTLVMYIIPLLGLPDSEDVFISDTTVALL